MVRELDTMPCLIRELDTRTVFRAKNRSGVEFTETPAGGVELTDRKRWVRLGQGVASAGMAAFTRCCCGLIPRSRLKAALSAKELP